MRLPEPPPTSAFIHVIPWLAELMFGERKLLWRIGLSISLMCVSKLCGECLVDRRRCGMWPSSPGSSALSSMWHIGYFELHHTFHMLVCSFASLAACLRALMPSRCAPQAWHAPSS